MRLRLGADAFDQGQGGGRGADLSLVDEEGIDVARRGRRRVAGRDIGQVIRLASSRESLEAPSPKVEVGGRTIEYSDTYEPEIQLIKQRDDPYSGISPAKVPLSMLPERIAKQRVLIDRLEQEVAAQLQQQQAQASAQEMVGKLGPTVIKAAQTAQQSQSPSS